MAKVERKPGPGAKTLKMAVDGLGKTTGKVGWFKSAHYPSGVPVAYIASVQEFGYAKKNIPPRLGMRATARASRAKWAEVAATGAKLVMAGKANAAKMMELLGSKAAGDLRKQIASISSPPLSPKTIAARLRRAGATIGRRTKARGVLGAVSSIVGALGSVKPEVDTQVLITHVTNTVEVRK